MKRYLIFILGVLVLLITLTSCAPTTFFSSGLASLDTTSQERGLGGYISDTEIQTRINVVLFEHDHVLHSLINVTVYEGRVLLTGCLKSKEMQEDAVRLAWQVPGVKMVMDETIVESSRNLVDYTKDKWLSTKIHSSFFVTPGISSRNFEIVVSAGNVYLVGIASDQKELDLAIELCRKVQGTKKVISYVRLMDLHEIRRRKLFNARKVLSPLAQKQKERDERHHHTRAKILHEAQVPLPSLDRKRK